jgi:hypothetical protein
MVFAGSTGVPDSRNSTVCETRKLANYKAGDCGIRVWMGAALAKLFVNTAVVECDSPGTLQTVLAAGLQIYVVRRLSDRCVVIDHDCLDEVQRLLRKSGRTPKITQE